jgi:TonB family protein
LEHEQIQRSEIKFGQIQLECLHAAPAGMPGNAFWCFSKESPAVRLTADTDGSRTIFNTVSNVSGQWIAKQVSWIKDSKPRLEMTVDTLDYPAHIQEGDVQATPDATAPEKIVVGDELPQPKKIHNQAPEYPINAKAEHIEGAVRVSATIERDGSVDELNVISGPKELQQPALNAIKQWRYEPYLLDGKPVMVQTQITVFFTLGRR